MKRYTQYKNILTVAISLIIVWILIVIGPLLDVLNTSLYEKYFGVKNSVSQNTPTSKIIIVDIDDESLESIWTFPFPRSTYISALDNINAFNPAVIGFDILFLDQSQDSEDDRKFIESIQSYENIVFWSAITSEKEVEKPFFNTTSWYLPPRINSNNNTVYSFFPSFIDRLGQKHEHFTLEILRKYYYHFSEDVSLREAGKYENDFYVFHKKTSYPLSRNGADDILINFISPKNFQRISFWDALDNTSLLATGVDFTDAIVLIGPAAEWFWDYFYTPNGREYGLNIHAHILSTLVWNKHITYFDFKNEWILIFLLIILSVYTNLSASKIILMWGNMIIIFIFWFFTPFLLLIFSNIILAHPAEIIFSLILAFSSANIVKYVIESMSKKRLGNALSEYVGSSIADEILLEHGKVNLDGEKREVVCTFSDIEWFTSLSESLSPEALVAFLRTYLSEMTNITMANDGHVDKFEWDAVMSLWGAFTSYSDEDCIKACRAALLQQDALVNISQQYKSILQNSLKVRIGIHEWDVIIWNIWAVGKKMEFTALWDTVNLASRLEWVNKYYGTYICVSEQVHAATKDVFAYRFLDEIRVQWKNTAVKIYELVWYKKDISESQFEHYMKFSRALWQYRKWNFTEALDMFMELVELWDIPSKVFLDRCREFQTTPPYDWEGIWDMEGK